MAINVLLKFHFILRIFDFMIAGAVISKKFMFIDILLIYKENNHGPKKVPNQGPDLILLHLLLYTAAFNRVKNIAVFSEKTDIPHLPNQSMVEISVMKL